MTLFAGFLASRSSAPGAAADIAGRIAKVISRHAGDVPQVMVRGRFCVVKVDIGALGEPGVVEAPGGDVAVVAGEPLIEQPARPSRIADLTRLAAAIGTGDDWPLRSCCGSYCAAIYIHARQELHLVADPLAVRSLYFCVQDRNIYFATALRILEALPALRRRVDLRGVCEIAAFGYPLGDRTPYRDVRALRAGERVTFRDERPLRRLYWRWDDLPPGDMPADELASELHARFMAAIRRRLDAHGPTLAFLSGGLDSRCVVAGLLAAGRAVQTLNFAPEGTQDLVLGRAAADALGTEHFELALGPVAFEDKRGLIHRAWRERAARGAGEQERPPVIWSGDGGSVGVGHVYLKPVSVEHARAGNLDAAIETHLAANRIAVPATFFAPRLASEVLRIPARGMREELDALHASDPGRNLHLFLMLNDQRRHLAETYEQIDRVRVELALPFFDRAFLEPILGAPVDAFLRHRFYNRWLARFGAAAAGVAWQAYPGHEPCPIPLPEGLRYQWQQAYTDADVRSIRAQTLARAAANLASASFPTGVLRKGKVWAAWVLSRLRLRNYDYVFHTMDCLCRYGATGSLEAGLD